MPRAIIRSSVCALLMAFGVFLAAAQTSSGGDFNVRKSVVSAGGDVGSNGIFKITGTIGQPFTEISTPSLFRVKSGFWTSEFAPTAAVASISGRVMYGKEQGVGNARVYLTDQDGNIRSALTSNLGYFQFADISVGQVLIVNVSHKRFQFNPQVIDFLDPITELVITAH